MNIRSINKEILFTVINLLLFVSAYTQDLSGYWQGVFNTDQNRRGIRRSFFLNMVLHQDGKKVEGRFSNSPMDFRNNPAVVYEISGIIGKKDKIPARMMVGKILYNNLLPDVAEYFLQFDDIHHFKNDTMELLYGNWIPNGLFPLGRDGSADTFWVRKLQLKDTSQKIPFVTDSTVMNTKSEVAFNKPDSLQTLQQSVKRKKSEQGHLVVNTKIITLNLYDNGIADDDTVSVFFNGKLLLSQQRISEKPIVINIELDENLPQNEIMLFAENLGSIPPNTALIVVTAGSERFELFSKANLKENAVLVFEYHPK